MKILFICGGLEPGRDGVGDYTRILAGECSRLGHQCYLVALNDKNMTPGGILDEPQLFNGGSVQCLRLSSSTPWRARMARVEESCHAFLPDIASFQFVGFGYHPKGLCFGLPNRLANLPVPRWHLMFHEISVGLGNVASRKQKFWGWAQQRIASRLIRKLAPVCVHSHAAPYLAILRKLGADAKHLPLFGNINVVANDPSPFLPPESNPSSGYFDVAFFGTVHPDWDEDEVIQLLCEIGSERGQEVRVIAIGKGGAHAEATWIMFRHGGIEVEEVGECCEAAVSRNLRRCVIGLSGYPPDLIQKSGAAAAMFEHGLSVLIPRKPLWGDRYTDEVRAACPLALIGSSTPDFELFQPTIAYPQSLRSIAEQFISNLQADADGMCVPQ